MLKSVRGVFREGRIVLLEPAPAADDTHVIITFLPSSSQVDLDERGIGPEQAGDLRSRLKTFASDWERPEMDAYDAL